MSDYQPLVALRNCTGMTVRIGVFEKATGLRMEADRVLLLVERASITETRYGLVVKRKGNTIHEFRKQGDEWIRLKPFTVWYDLDEPEVHVAYPGQTPEEYRAKREWEDMCHRPGTDKSPMDNLARRQQGIA